MLKTLRIFYESGFCALKERGKMTSGYASYPEPMKFGEDLRINRVVTRLKSELSSEFRKAFGRHIGSRALKKEIKPRLRDNQHITLRSFHPVLQRRHNEPINRQIYREVK